MFHIVRKIEEHTTNDIFQELDRTYKTVLDFVHEVQDALADDPEFDLSGVCEADEIYVIAGEKGLIMTSVAFYLAQPLLDAHEVLGS